MKYIFLFIFLSISNANAMNNVLVIRSSASGNISVTNNLANSLLEQIMEKYPQANIVDRDLNKNPVANVSSDSIVAFYTPLEKQDDKIKKILEPSNLLVQEILSSDVIIVCAPMYNFGIPSSLKAWIDNIVRPGLTFKYTNKGVEGLMGDKKVIILTSSSSGYSSLEGKKMDFVSPYLKTIFGFMGVKNIEIINNEYSRNGEIKTFKTENIKVGELSKDVMKYYHQVSDHKAISEKIKHIMVNL